MDHLPSSSRARNFGRHRSPPPRNSRPRDSDLSAPRDSQSPLRRRDSMAYRRSRSPAASPSFENHHRSRHHDGGKPSRHSYVEASERSVIRAGSDDWRKPNKSGDDRTPGVTPTISSALPIHPLLLPSHAATSSHSQLDASQNMSRSPLPPPPPPHIPAPPLPPPPPLPTPPSFLSAEPTPQPVPLPPRIEPTAEEKRVKWVERIK